MKSLDSLDLTQVLVDVDKDGIATVTLNREAKRNALDARTVEELVDLFSTIPRAGVRAVVLKGAGTHFCAGLDLVEHFKEDRSPADFMHLCLRWHEAFNKMEYGGVPIIAALKGAVVGGGLELASSAHIRVADRTTYFALPEGQRGLFTGGGATIRVADLVGKARMIDMMLTGRVYQGKEAMEVGLCQYLVDDSEAKAMELARAAAAHPPLTNFAICSAISHMQNMSALDAAYAEAVVAGIVNTQPDARGRLEAFANKTAARSPEVNDLTEQTPLRGIGFKLISVAVFMAMSSLIKATAHEVPPGEAVFFRSFFAIPVILVWLYATHEFGAGLRTSNPLGHFWRGLLGTTAMGLGFAGLGLLPLPEVTAIGYAAPLLTVVFAAMFLGEPVRAFRITTVGLGMAGVLIILSPRFSALGTGGIGTTETLGAVLVLVGAVFSALAQVFVRKLVMEERTTAIVFYFSVTSASLSLLTIPFGWAWPSPSAAAMLVGAGLLGGLGQVFLTSSYRFADASVVAPFEYASMILALGVGYFAFDEVPTLRVLTGAAVVVTAGIAIIWRERQLGLQRDKQRKSMTPQG